MTSSVLKWGERLQAELNDTRPIYHGPDGIIRFVREILCVTPTDYQEEILRAFVEKRRVAVRAPHGVGKTALSSWIVWWGLLAHDNDVKVITTASAWQQLKHYTWVEIRKWASVARFDELGVRVKRGDELLELGIKLPGNREAFAVASQNAAFIEGAHAKTLIYVYDEAKAIPVATWDAAEGAFSNDGADGTQAYALAISTPGDPSGRFYDISTRKPGYEDWWTRHITLDEAINAGRISQAWVDQRKKQWGEKSAVFVNRVLGEFDTSGEMNVVPLAWVEAANLRYLDLKSRGELGGGKKSLGVDPAWLGEDKTALALLEGSHLTRLQTYSKENTMQTVARVRGAIDKDVPCAIDTIGVGAGVFDRLSELDYNVIAVNVSERTDDTDSTMQVEFVNKRASLWWSLRESLDPDNPSAMALPPDDDLTGDLTAPTYGYNTLGKIVIEPKDALRERIGRSPDKADAVALAIYAARFARKPIML